MTTEDPENKFTPDYGKILTYRSTGGYGVRLDGGMGYAGAVITPFYDSLLVKITAFGRDFDLALTRMDRALAGISHPWSQDQYPLSGKCHRRSGFPLRPRHHHPD